MSVEVKKTVVVIGGSKGLGFSISKRFAAQGYNVAILGRNFELIKEEERKLCTLHFCELTNHDSIKRAIAEVHEITKAIDIIVNCAAVLDKFEIENITIDQWNEIISINLTAPFFVIQEALPYLKLSNHGRIINISSNAGRMGGFENGACYAATKGGIIAMTYNLARKLAPYGITVNCIAPGPFQTEMFNTFSEESKTKVISRIPINRIGTVEEITEAVIYFASEKASYTTGAVLDVNGGIFMG